MCFIEFTIYLHTLQFLFNVIQFLIVAAVVFIPRKNVIIEL